MKRLLLVLIATGALACCCTATPQRLIIDTDMSSDCDDVGALCLAHALADNGEAEIVAVLHNTGLNTGIGAVASINEFYGRPDIPLGAYKGKYDADMRGWPNRSYVDDLVAHSAAKIKNYSQVPDAVDTYRSVLAAAPPRSVVISSIGFTTNLEALLRSGPDRFSSLSGPALLASRVKSVAWMGGRYPTSHSPLPGGGTAPNGSWAPGQPEHNFGFRNISHSTAYTLAHWPAAVPIYFLGWEVGYDIWTGGGLTNHTAEDNPCRRAYIDHQGPSKPRESWDPATTLFAHIPFCVGVTQYGVLPV